MFRPLAVHLQASKVRDIEITIADWLCVGRFRFRVRIPPGSWMSVSWERVLSGRGLCDGAITNSEESYRWWCVWLVVET